MKSNIQVEQLTKCDSDLLAVDHISFEIERGELFGFLGPNDAVKTITIKMLIESAKPARGTAFIEGVNIRKNPNQAQ